MQVSEGKSDAGGIKFDTPLLEFPPIIFEVRIELPPLHEIDHKINLVVCLKGVIKPNEKRVVSVLKNRLFRKRVLDLLVLNKVLFVKYLYRIMDLRVLFSGKKYLPESPSSQKLQNYEIVHAHILWTNLVLAIKLLGLFPPTRHFYNSQFLHPLIVIEAYYL